MALFLTRWFNKNIFCLQTKILLSFTGFLFFCQVWVKQWFKRNDPYRNQTALPFITGPCQEENLSDIQYVKSGWVKLMPVG